MVKTSLRIKTLIDLKGSDASVKPWSYMTRAVQLIDEEDYDGALNKIRKALEVEVKVVYEGIHGNLPKKERMQFMMQSTQLRRALPEHIRTYIGVAQVRGNDGSHADADPTMADAVQGLDALLHVQEWLYREYWPSSKNPRDLRNISTPANGVYRSGDVPLDSTFLRLHLENSVFVRRAVGYFSTSVFRLAMPEFMCFFQGGGVYQIVCSEVFSQRDVAIFDAARTISSAISELKLKDFSELGERRHSKSAKSTWTVDQFIQWLIYHRRLQIRIARVHPVRSRSVFHEKIGIYMDTFPTDHHPKRLVATTGSANETRNAYVNNFERIDVFHWRTDLSRALTIFEQFDELWENPELPGLEIEDLHVALCEGWIKVRQSSRRKSDVDGQDEDEAYTPMITETLVVPSEFDIRPYQEEAYQSWKKAGRGILDMATGTGKTVTSLYMATKVSEPFRSAGDPLLVVMVAPLIHLVDQWDENARKFGLKPIRCHSDSPRWRDRLRTLVRSLNAGNDQMTLASIAVTMSTLKSPDFHQQIDRLNGVAILLIGDEIHEYASEETIKSFPPVAYTIGLSATYAHYRDEERTQRLEEYFGDCLFEYSMGEAIRSGFLCAYKYFPIPVVLSEDELEEYTELSKKLAKFYRGDGLELHEGAQALLSKRARLIASAESKLPALKAWMLEHRSSSNILVYCGDGRVDNEDLSDTMRQVERVAEIVGNEVGMRCATFTAATSPKDRTKLLRSFAKGQIQVLIAIRCLDQGVDVPSTRIAHILASSSNPRQFIQRRGRVLRNAAGKDEAEIYDYFVHPPFGSLSPSSAEYRVMRSLLLKEAQRGEEFCENARNPSEARQVLLDLGKAFRQ